jgi:MEMO1 family protein
MKSIREPAVSGMFYPSSPHELKDQINMLLDSTHFDEEFENPFGIISPHAGYIYSGKTAAYAYNAIRGQNFSTVVIISPSHREYFPGVSIYNGDAYRTPLGDVFLNKEMISKLCENSKLIFEGMNGHRAEHAIEVQIPFLQMILKDFQIIPIVIGDQRKNFIYELAEKLAAVINDEIIIVASSDLSHFHTKQKAGDLDTIVEERIKNFEYEKFLHDIETEKCEACGGGPIVAMMKTADLCGKKKSKILSRSDSGDITGDTSEVVGYLSAIIYS